VPSDTRYEKSDVSLYDHLRSSAAIAACLFRRHAVALEKGKNLDRINEFILVGGDFSGIQDYIFDITNRGSGGASKRLRARSFFVSLFSEVTIHKILNALGLPLVCNLFSAGGKFLLLAPNIDEVDDALQTVKTEIEEEIHQTFFNQFSFLMSWMRIRGFREEFKTYSFFETAEEMFHQLESEKLRKSQGVLRDEKAGVWNVNAFKATKMYGQYKDTGDCKICGKGPATILEETDQETGESVLSCPICYRDKATIGQELPKSNYVAFGKGFFAKDADGKKIAIFSPKSNGYQKEKESYYVKLLKDCEDTDEYYLIYDIGGNTEKQVPNNQKRPIRKYIANHVPLGPGERVL
ncbi:type III-A CRISPR-associated protein Cas10/Csm1, partial [bacterium]|nr:type III-A CRISPR-associated protein Cas10/Csm1 [bacterium]